MISVIDDSPNSDRIHVIEFSRFTEFSQFPDLTKSEVSFQFVLINNSLNVIAYIQQVHRHQDQRVGTVKNHEMDQLQVQKAKQVLQPL